MPEPRPEGEDRLAMGSPLFAMEKDLLMEGPWTAATWKRRMIKLLRKE